MNPEPAVPVAVMCFIVDDEDRLLWFSRDGTAWRVMGGQLETGETIPQCVAREIQEELGTIRYRFIDVLDAHIFAYPGLGNMLSVFCLLKYEGGVISPASDMSPYAFQWIKTDQLHSIDVQCPFQRELVQKAIHTARDFQANGNRGFWKFQWKNLS
jgi:8-oxo-dGTP pyrophosphatase MutT (NUDIX family)